jgi:flagellar protein FliO/FliZ
MTGNRKCIVPEIITVKVIAAIAVFVALAGYPLRAAADGGPLDTAPAEVAFSWGGYFQAIFLMSFLLGVLWLSLWLLRRSGKLRFLPQPGKFPKDGLVVECMLPVGPRKSIMVVRFLNKSLVLGVTDQNINLLTETERNYEPESKFSEYLDSETRGNP